MLGAGAAINLIAALGGVAPVGVVEGTLGRFDRDTLRPIGQTIGLAEAHTGPVFSRLGGRFAIGVSSPGAPGCQGPGGSACGSSIRAR